MPGQFSRRTLGRLAGVLGAGALTAGTMSSASAMASGWRASGAAVGELSDFDDQVKQFMQARGIPCGQLAVTYRGRLVLARGYTNSENAPLVQPTSVFRLASLTKSITAAAILRLVQAGQLSLTTPITDVLDLRPAPGRGTDPRLAAVAATFRRLGSPGFR